MNKKKIKGKSDDDWDGFKKVWLECDSKGCEVWEEICVPEAWKESKRVVKCKLCMYDEMVNLKVENERLKDEICEMKQLDVKRCKDGLFEQIGKKEKAEIKSFASMVKKMDEDSTLDKLKRLDAGMMVTKEDIRKEVIESGVDETRKKRLIVFNMDKSERKNDREQVLDMIDRMGVNVRKEDVKDVIRMRDRDGSSGVARPLIVEFKSEYDKWTVLRNKSDLRGMNEYRRVFLELDRTKEERAANRLKVVAERERKMNARRQEEE